MPLKEFFIIRETGHMLFHHQFAETTSNGDPVLTSGLIAAIFQFAQQVEQDMIDFIRMRRVSFIFRKTLGLIFVLSMDSETNPIHFEAVMYKIEKHFFRLFPEAKFDPSAILEVYEDFRNFLSNYLKPVEKRAEVLGEVMLIIGVREDELVERSLEEVGSAVARKLLSARMDEIQLAEERGFVQILEVVEGVFSDLGINSQPAIVNGSADIIQIQLHCKECQLCQLEDNESFCRGFLEEILENTTETRFEVKLLSE
ncbi:MAG: hypothetical protein ACFFBD_11110 [Candidatus Hodarchaeota archaeon]